MEIIVEDLIAALQKCEKDAVVRVIGVSGSQIFKIISISENRWHYTENPSKNSTVDIRVG
jgi:hypothetical protein